MIQEEYRSKEAQMAIVSFESPNNCSYLFFYQLKCQLKITYFFKSNNLTNITSSGTHLHGECHAEADEKDLV